MDIIKANKCLRYQYGPLVKGSFNNAEVGVIEGEPIPLLILLKEALKAQVAIYKKAMEDTVKATAAVEDAATEAAAAAEDTLVEPSKPIKLDSDNKNNSNDNAYAAFKDINNIKAIGVEDKGDSILD